jgi:hypothetical protein
MTAYVTTTLQNLLRRSLFPGAVRSAHPRAQRPAQALGDAETMPMLFRSEGFAEDLFDSHPSN